MSSILRSSQLRAVCYAALLSVLPASVSAQSFGVKGGVALSSISFDDTYAESSSLKAGFVGGGFFGFALPLGLRLDAEVLVAEERATLEDIQDDVFRYLDVPVLVRYGIGGTRFHVSGGVVPRWLLSADETIAGETSSIKDGVADRDLAIAFGGGAQLRRNLSVDVRYLWGREGVYRRESGDNAGFWRTWQVTASYAFRR